MIYIVKTRKWFRDQRTDERFQGILDKHENYLEIEIKSLPMVARTI